MKRIVFGLFGTVLLAGYLGTLIAVDPGYVLMVYDDYSMETSLWVLVCLLVIFFVLFYLLSWSISYLLSGSIIIRKRMRASKRARQDKVIYEALVGFMEGDFLRASKLLNRVDGNSTNKGITYLVGARAMNASEGGELTKTYLNRAVEADSTLRSAANTLAVELALFRKEPDVALRVLSSIELNSYTAELKINALRMNNDWRASLSALPDLQKFLETHSFERDIALMSLKAEAGKDTELNALFKALPKRLQYSHEVLLQYIKSLEYKGHGEQVLRLAIKKSWDSECVLMYADADFDTLGVRCKTAETWLKTHEDDAALHYCLGCLYELRNETEKAKRAFVRSIELGGSTISHKKLGLLHSRQGDFESSSYHLRLALTSS